MNDTLRCECGGAVEIVDQTYSEETDRAFESYECVCCGRRGSFTFGNGRSDKTGCLARE